MRRLPLVSSFHDPRDIKKIISKYNKYSIKIKYSKERVGDMKRSFAKSNKIKKELNWNLKTDLKNGLMKTSTLEELLPDSFGPENL